MVRKTTILFLFLCSITYAQEVLPEEYFDNIKKADAYYQSKDYKNAAFAFSSAFKSNGWKGTIIDRYNAACSWSLAKIPDSAFFNLFRLANKMQFTDVNRLKTEADFYSLHEDLRWQTLLEVVQKNKDSAEVNLNIPVVRLLDSIFIEDQKYRLKLGEINNNAILSLDAKNKLISEINKKSLKADKNNLKKVIAILDKYGWMGPEEIGEQGNLTLFLVIQHSDLPTQQKYLPLMREAVKINKAFASDLALLEDRIALGQGKKQIYGSQMTMDFQTGQYMLSPIEDEVNVNKRRAAVGLEPIEEYVKQWGIKYKFSNPTATEPTSRFSICLILGIATIVFTISLFLSLYCLIKKRKNKKADQDADIVSDNTN
jgi:hypothetical protein